MYVTVRIMHEYQDYSSNVHYSLKLKLGSKFDRFDVDFCHGPVDLLYGLQTFIDIQNICIN